jgi:hypothetical protein
MAHTITQIGKTCHNKCAIYHMAGDCIMPREGVFALLLMDGPIACGNYITPLPPGDRKIRIRLGSPWFKNGIKNFFVSC